MLNTKSNFLVIVIATHNRLELLKKAIASIKNGVRCDHEVIVIDGQSNDGTVEFLKENKDVTSVFQNELIGASRTYNYVWKRIECKYTCWLSDDTEIVDGSLDLAVSILEKDSEIGMVGLKMKDTNGPWIKHPYMGGISTYGILTCNHGVLKKSLLSEAGYFNESYKTYMIDVDLTASVLSLGKKVVMTKQISILHNRFWADNDKNTHGVLDEMKIYKNKIVYIKKFTYLKKTLTPITVKRKQLVFDLYNFVYEKFKNLNFLLNTARNIRNLLTGRFISYVDPIRCIGKKYHFVQQIPENLILIKENPYRHLINKHY